MAPGVRIYPLRMPWSQTSPWVPLLWAGFFVWRGLTTTRTLGWAVYGALTALALFGLLLTLNTRRRDSRLVHLVVDLPFFVWISLAVVVAPSWPWRILGLAILSMIAWAMSFTFRKHDWRVELGADSLRIKFFATRLDIPYGNILFVDAYDSFLYHLPVIGRSSLRATVVLRLRRPVRRLRFISRRNEYLYLDETEAQDFIREVSARLQAGPGP
jgi:hypothetical protein